MAIYEMQGGRKPARNYLGKQKTVSNVPIKWKSGPDAPETELAYITEAEKNLLLKEDLHGSLKNGPNTGPDDIMSLDSQGDYTRDRSPGAYTGGGGSPAQQSQSTGTSQQALRNRAMNEAHMKAILTGQKNIGQTSAVSRRTRRGAVPEYAYTPSGELKYVGSSTKGKQGWFSKLLGRGNVRGTRSIKFNPETGRYESEDENVGDIQPGFGGRILGGLAGLTTSIPFVGPMIGGAIDKGKGIFGQTQRDMSQFNRLGLYGEPGLEDFEQEEYYTRDKTPMARTDRWTTPAVTGTDQNFNMALPMGSAEGGRIGYAFGTPDPDEPTEDIFEFMQDQNIPHGEMVEGGPTEEQIAMVMDMDSREMGIDEIVSLTGLGKEVVRSILGVEMVHGGLASLV